MSSDLGTCSAALAPVTGIIVGLLTSGGCAPYKWDREGRWIVHEYAQARPVTKLWQYDGGLIGGEDLKAGDVNCRYDAKLRVEAEDRCEALTSQYDITREKLFLLNPVLRGDCSNIKYNTPYCTEGCEFFLPGFIRPWKPNWRQSLSLSAHMMDDAARNTRMLHALVLTLDSAATRRLGHAGKQST